MTPFSVSTIAAAGAGSPGMVVVRGERDISGVGQVRRALTDLENGPGDVVALELAARSGIDPGPTPVISPSPDHVQAP